MKTRVFELTVSEQRVIVVFFVAWVLWVAYATYKAEPQTMLEMNQPSPSPGILP